jgi:hypothetical protein
VFERLRKGRGWEIVRGDDSLPLLACSRVNDEVRLCGAVARGDLSESATIGIVVRESYWQGIDECCDRYLRSMFSRDIIQGCEQYR